MWTPSIKPRGKALTVTAISLLICLLILFRFGELSSVSASQTGKAIKLVWTSGSYNLHYRIKTSFDLASIVALASQQSGRQQLSQTEMGLNGRLVIDASQLGSMKLWFDELELSDVIYDGVNSNEMSSIQRELLQTIQVKLHPHGNFSSVSYPAECQQICRRIWSYIVSELQTPSMPINSSSSWQEQMTSVDAQLKYGNQLKSRQWTKQLLMIESFHPLRLIAHKLRKSARGTIIYQRQDNFLTGMKGEMSFSFDQPQALIYRQAWSLEMSYLAPLGQHKDLARNNDTLSWHPGSLDAMSEQIAVRNAWQRELSGANLTSIKQDLDKSLGRQAELDLYKKIRAFISMYPEQSREFLQQLVSGEYNGSYNRLVAVALGRVGHAEAQAVLQAAIEQRLSLDKEVLNFIPLLAQTNKPTASTVSLLERMAEAPSELRNTALLAYGQTLGSYAIEQPSKAWSKVDALLNRFQSASAQDRLILLDAFGNSSLKELFPKLQAILNSEVRPDILIAALKTYASMQGPEIRQYLSEQSKLAEADLASAAWRSLANHPHTVELENRAIQTLEASGDTRIHLACLDWLWAHRQMVKDIKIWLQRIRHNEQLDAPLRSLAQGYYDLLDK